MHVIGSIFRVHRNGKILSKQTLQLCIIIIKHNTIKHITLTNNNNSYGQRLSKTYLKRITITKGNYFSSNKQTYNKHVFQHLDFLTLYIVVPNLFYEKF